MNFNCKNIVLALALLTLPIVAFAQPDLPSEEVEVIKDFEARLEETNKLDLSPTLPPLDAEQKNFSYSIPTRTLNVDYPAPKIKPLAQRRDKIEPSYNGYTKLGYGLPASPYGELGYHYDKKDLYDIGFHAKHHSANYADLEHQRFSDTNVDVDGTYYSNLGFAVGANLGFRSDEVHFYGYDHEAIEFTRDSVRQRFNTFEAGARFFNGVRTQGDINYEISVNSYFLREKFLEGKEDGVDLKLEVVKWFAEKHSLNVVLQGDFTKYVTINTEQSLNNIFAKPSFTYHGNSFKIKGGANFAMQKDSFFIFPDVEATVNIAGTKLAAFAGWKGDLQKNSFRNLSDVNPFLQSEVIVKNTRYNHYYGGLKGNIKFVEYQVQVGFKQANDLALYLNDPSDYKRFNVIYDNVDIFNIEGTVGLKPLKGLDVLITLGQNVYNPDNESKVWHLPSLEGNIAAKYLTLKKKLRLKGECYIADGAPYLDENLSQGNLGALFDLSLGAEYLVTKNIGLFFDANNLFANKRERWYRYPSYGINILGGVTAKF